MKYKTTDGVIKIVNRYYSFYSFIVNLCTKNLQCNSQNVNTNTLNMGSKITRMLTSDRVGTERSPTGTPSTFPICTFWFIATLGSNLDSESKLCSDESQSGF